MMTDKYSFRIAAAKYPYPINVINVILNQDCTEYPEKELKWFENEINNVSKGYREVIELYFSEKWSYGKIADHYNVTQERIRQVIHKTLERMDANHRRFLANDIPFKDRSIFDIRLPLRVSNAIGRWFKRNRGIDDPKVEDLLDLTIEDIRQFRNIGSTYTRDLVELLNEHGLSLKESNEEDSRL